MVASFMSGLTLCELFYRDAVRPLLDEAFPGLPHAAARLGQGSEVLGFDTERSTDHDWGPRLQLFLAEDDAARHGAGISALLSARLPKQVRGWSTHFVAADDPVRHMTDTDGPVAHEVQITDVATWSASESGFDVRAGVTVADWLALPTQRLAEVTGGAVFHDDLGDLTDLRSRLNWYPDDVWRYVLAAQWRRIAQEEPFVGRTAEAGDELGSRMVAARLARDVMRLCLLLARRYPPYSKWLGTALSQVPEAASITVALHDALEASDSVRRQASLCDAYEAAGAWQNRLDLAAPVEPTRRPFHNRPYPVIGADRFADALVDRISDRALASLPLIGAIDQYVDNTDAIGRMVLMRAFAGASQTAALTRGVPA